MTDIHDAARLGDLEDAKTLLTLDPASANARDQWHRTPLHRAAANGRKDAVELLLASGADVNALDDGNKTPLDRATIDTMELLRQHGGSKGEDLVGRPNTELVKHLLRQTNGASEFLQMLYTAGFELRETALTHLTLARGGCRLAVGMSTRDRNRLWFVLIDEDIADKASRRQCPVDEGICQF